MREQHITADEFNRWLTGDVKLEPFTGHLAHACHLALTMPRRVYAMVCAEAGADRTNEAAKRNVVAVAR